VSAVDDALMREHYARAGRVTPPKIAVAMTGIVNGGYWLDEKEFFFLAEHIDPLTGRLLLTPSIARVDRQGAEAVIPLAELAGLLSEQTGEPIDAATLSCAAFDMPDTNTLAVSILGQDFLVDRRKSSIRERRESLDVPALYSADGRYACVVRGHDLWVRERNTGRERALTTDGEPFNAYARLSDTSLSAIAYRRQPSPVGLWSPDSQWFITHRIDERATPSAIIVQHAPPGGGRPVEHVTKVALPGEVLPQATFVAIHVPSGHVHHFKEWPVSAPNSSPFHARLIWFSGSETVSLLRRDRYAKRAELIALDLASGTGSLVLTEAAGSGYVDLNPVVVATPNVRTLLNSGEIVWFSERDGWGHLYLYDARTGALKNRITQGPWVVRTIVHVDEGTRTVWFLAGGLDAEADPGRRSLCSVNLDGSDFKVWLTHDGDLQVPVTEPCGLEQNRPFKPSNASPGWSPDGTYALARYTSLERGNRTELVNLASRRGFTIASVRPPAEEMPPRHITALAADGVTRLHGAMFFPQDFDESRRYPLIVYIYPGPQVPHKPQSYRSVNAAPARSLAELGFVTLMLDPRGMPVSSRAFHQAGYPALQEPQIADHACVVRELCDRYSFIDGGRIGIIGHSAGGSAALRALCDYGEIFKVGVAVCAYNDPALCPSAWADKYRGPPAGESRAVQANGAAVHRLQGKVLLVSGDLDENVPLSHTLSIADALVRANRDFDLLIVPNETHLLMMTSPYVQRRIFDYFVRNLAAEDPPGDVEFRFEAWELERFQNRYAWEFRP
jgi:dipeptidyl aminopeptidase/acylaminoacyl peptidase